MEPKFEGSTTTPLTKIMTESLRNETKKRQLRTMQIYGAGLVGILIVFGLSFFSAYWRVSKSDRYEGTPFKSVSDAETLFKSLETKPAETPSEETTNIVDSKEEIMLAKTPLKTIELNPQKLEITDPEILQDLRQQVFNSIDKSWQIYPSFNSGLIYEVTANENGEIVDFRHLNQPAKDYLEDIPLPQLLKPQSSENKRPQATAKFTVLFAPSGVLEVNP